MKILIVGASGATGKNLVNQALAMDLEVKVIVRATSSIPDNWKRHDKIKIIEANIHEIKVVQMADYIQDCQGIASCLGHNLSLKGIYGKPRKLVTDAVSLICEAITQNEPKKPVKLVLMNTAGNRNLDEVEPISPAQKIVVGLIRWLLPPHRDNEQAADYLRIAIGQNHPLIEWVVVRPDSLIDEEHVSAYTIHNSPTRSAIFNPGKTSRIHVGHLMASLMRNPVEWEKWRGKMPVIYNKT